MSKLSKLRRKVRRLKRENLALIIECNAARVRAGEAHEALQEAQEPGWVTYGKYALHTDKLDG